MEGPQAEVLHFVFYFYCAVVSIYSFLECCVCVPLKSPILTSLASICNFLHLGEAVNEAQEAGVCFNVTLVVEMHR